MRANQSLERLAARFASMSLLYAPGKVN